ncbi:hypothetical protein M406DRAFT_48364 [Cryphonectria parasitica EP155]|uniref:Phosphoribulokinase/uridine kinase domain-containing protein n=1 Tax=Cryphonectria parasitica (strain ATCC 38755 / EP155) TaxID=660469 RepID=A0A9P4XSQ4_CRYP1|nr:uncharacterized protein M406DRAFT_48364 [Cryphonectria parasitica EP155]KAF3760614.1 hypothetical protein M406DRAFT_48364 [Cryphonectria parasitica EP155]
MDDQVERLVDKAWGKFLQTPPEHRLMIGIGGIPGSGKTTLSQIVTERINARHQTHAAAQGQSHSSPIAAFVPMDGYHLTLAQLSAMPDPVTAHARRGAEFTFDGASFLKLVQSLREPLPSTTTTNTTTQVVGEAAPSFDHAIKDPKPDDIPILPTHRVLVFEGNYIALDRDPWRTAAQLMDEVWFVEVDPAVARKRLAARHVRAGIVATEEEGDRRAVENDLPNGEEIMGARVAVDEVVMSREDGSWVHG